MNSITCLVLEEITEWLAPYDVPNHLYIVDEKKEFCYGYRKQGQNEVVWFGAKRLWSPSRRKFNIEGRIVRGIK